MKQEFHEYRTSNAMDWDTMLSLVRKLYRDGDYRMSLLIGCGCFFGLRISDILTLTWSMILDGDKFTIYEKKTGKRRVVKVNKGFQKHVKQCYDTISAPTQCVRRLGARYLNLLAPMHLWHLCGCRRCLITLAQP